jgi:hypothetical protein
MKSKNLTRFLAGLLMIIFFTCACGPSAPPETRAGNWKAAASFGEFTFTVAPDGTGITDIAWNYKSCSSAIVSGSVTISQEANFNPALVIEGNKFTLKADQVGIGIQGTFSRDGTQASGSWKAGECSGGWKATKSQ